jgi:hypothetical protein
MANLSVDTIKSEDGSSPIVFDANLDFSQSEYTVLPKGTTAQRPTGVDAGSLRFNTDTKLVEQYNGIEWVTLNSYGVGRGVFGGGYISTSPNALNTIDYLTIATTGNALSFGDLTIARAGNGACSSSTRGVIGGGYSSIAVNTIDYITISTTGNATDFGDLTETKEWPSSCSSSTRGIFAGGNQVNSPTALLSNVIEYITIATTGNATDFGDMTFGRNQLSACSSSTRGVFGSGYTYLIMYNIMDYVTIATTGNATDFGDLTESISTPGACSSSTRGVFAGGIKYNPYPTTTLYNIIDYITIATTGNANNFGDLTTPKSGVGACSSSTRGVFGGGYTPTRVNTIDFITIASQGTNANTFGQLTQARDVIGALSDAHGGLA